MHTLESIYHEIKEEIANVIDTYYKFKGENRSPKEITRLIETLQDVSNLEDYKKMLEEKLKTMRENMNG
jgi:hypothetical protein